MKEINVVAALIKKDGKVLIARRSTGDDTVIDKWEFPGGKVEPCEKEEEAIEREIKEEFDLEIQAEKFLVNNIYKYPNKVVNLKLYSCNYVSGEFHLHDHSEYVWVLPEALLDYDLAPADVRLAIFVKENS